MLIVTNLGRPYTSAKFHSRGVERWWQAPIFACTPLFVQRRPHFSTHPRPAFLGPHFLRFHTPVPRCSDHEKIRRCGSLVMVASGAVHVFRCVRGRSNRSSVVGRHLLLVRFFSSDKAAGLLFVSRQERERRPAQASLGAYHCSCHLLCLDGRDAEHVCATSDHDPQHHTKQELAVYRD